MVQKFKEGFLSGIGWSFGATIGFVIISTVIVLALNFLDGLPIAGKFIASIVEETQVQLERRSLFAPR